MAGFTEFLGKKKLSTGDIHSLQEIWLRSMRRFASSRLADFPKVKYRVGKSTTDVLQESLVVLVQRWNELGSRETGFENSKAFLSYCRQLVVHDLTDYSRFICREKREGSHEAASLDGHDIADDAEHQLRMKRLAWIDSQLKAIAEQDTEMGLAINSVFFLSQTYQETAEKLGTTKYQVEKLVKEATEFLARQAEECDDFD